MKARSINKGARHFWDKVNPRKSAQTKKVSDEEDKVLCHNDALNEETTNTAPRWDEIELISSTEVPAEHDGSEKDHPEEKAKKRKKFKKRAKKVTWRVMKGTWKTLRLGMVTIAQSTGSLFSFTGAMTSMMNEYSTKNSTKNSR